MNKFSKAAQKVTSLSPIMVGRTKLETEEVVDKDLTVIAFDFAPKFDKTGNPVVNPETGEVETFGVVVFKEHPDKFYCVGTIFTQVCHVWADDYDGDIEAANSDLEKEGGVQVRFTLSRTKKGNNIVSVNILG